MVRERTLAVAGLLGIALALHFGAAADPPIEVALFVVALALVTATASRQFERWLGGPGLARWFARSALVLGPTLALAVVYLGGPSRWDDLGLRGDFPVNEAFVRTLRDALSRAESLRWSTRIAPGDPTPDLYPMLGHAIVARASLWLGESVSLHRVVVGAAVLAHVSVALGVARAARTTGAPWTASAIVGLACLYDAGSDFGWGTRAIWFWGFYPSTLALGVFYGVLPTVLTSLQRPSRARWLSSCAGLAFSAALHPVGLVLSGALVVGLLAAVPVSRASERGQLVAMSVWATIGTALSAPLWAPASQRLLDYGVHFGTPTVPVDIAIERMAVGRLPDGSYPVLVLAGWAGAVWALAARRAGPAVLALASLFLVSLYAETWFLDLGLAPSVASVRWQSYRVGTFLKPMLYVLAAHGLALGATFAAHLARPKTRAWLRASTLGVATLAWWLGEPDVAAWIDAQATARRVEMQGPYLADRVAWAELRAYLAAERERLPPNRHARLLLYCPLDCPYELMQLAWDPGLPLVLHHPAPAGHFLRDQFFDTSPENLRRFGIRWTLSVARTPPPGDPSSERRFGNLVLRENPSWDGTFAHAVGPGEPSEVRVEVVEGLGFDLFAEAPARVELGTPFYPRLRATSDGRAVPLEPLRVRRAGPDAVDPSERAVALSVPAGRTRVRADGPLPSDGRGWGLFVLAVVGGGAMLAARHRRFPVGARLERFSTRGRKWLRSRGPLGASFALGLGLVFATPLGDATRRGLRFGVLFPAPRIALEVPGRDEAVACEPRNLGRSFACGDVEIAMVVAPIIQDWHVGWPVPVPAVEVRRAPPGSTLLFSTDAPLEGEYFGACEACTAELVTAGGPRTFGAATSRLRLERLAERTLRIHILGAVARAALVRADLVEPADARLQPVEETPF